MAVDIRFFDTLGAELSFDKVTGGFSFGQAKKGTPYVVPVVVKNLGADPATGLSVKASTLNASVDVSQATYNSEILAASWKSFSLTPTDGFAPTLTLPNIGAGATMKGINEYVEKFTNPLSSAFIPDALTGHTFQWSGSSLICKDGAESDGKIYAYADATGWGDNLEQDFHVVFDMPKTTTAGAAFIMFCMRKNCLGDEKGYLINVKRTYNATTNLSTIFFEIRKGAGVKSNAATDFGTTLLASNAVNWVDDATLRIKCFTNASNLPEIKIWYGAVKNSDPTVSFGTGVNTTYSYVDTANTYKFAGKVSAVYGSGGTGILVGSPNQYELKSAKLFTDDPLGKVYVKTIVGEGAVDGQAYNSALELSYDEV